jgi:hypothetical protein
MHCSENAFIRRYIIYDTSADIVRNTKGNFAEFEVRVLPYYWSPNIWVR